MAGPDWRLLETFVRVAEKGSLSAGAVELGMSQPTASRNIRALEEDLGARLFVRHARGLALTDRGAELFAVARGLDDGIQKAFRTAAGLREVPKGTVRISVNESLGVYALPKCFAQLRQDCPEIMLKVVIDNAVADLSRRDADIAVRMFRPEQLALVTRRVGSVDFGLFASCSYLDHCGIPSKPNELGKHTLIGSDRDLAWLRPLAELGLSPKDFAFRTDSFVAQTEAIRSGVGIGATHRRIAACDPTLVRVLPQLSIAPVEIWLVMHEDLRGSIAVRTVFDALALFLRQYASR